ncbi:restriction endonuclease [Clostridium sp.]|jgi:HJR/Mrr/RecB family endonuclease|uniref:restriction endonuclease n=1 Tax=Clostridium sp. TaxID=1506 RepID=UPI0039F449BA
MIYDYITSLSMLLANFISFLLLVPISISIIKTIYRLINLVKTYKKESIHIEILKEGILTTDDLEDLSPKEFEHWSALFLEKQGFTDIIVSPYGPDGGKDIVCKRGTETYYVECKKYSKSNFVDVEIARKLVGAMEVDEIKNGIIITTGLLTKRAIDYIYSLPKPYSITVYDGASLVKEYNNLVGSSLVNA